MQETTRLCARCGEPLPVGRRRKFCSAKCTSRFHESLRRVAAGLPPVPMMVRTHCMVCDAEMVDARPDKKFCSQVCRTRNDMNKRGCKPLLPVEQRLCACGRPRFKQYTKCEACVATRNARARAQYAAEHGEPTTRECDDCGKPFVPRFNDRRYRYCSARCKRQAWVRRNPAPPKEPKPPRQKQPKPVRYPASLIWIKTCECTAVFVCRAPNAERCPTCRADHDRRKRRAHAARRRARMTTTAVERFVHLDIFKRDGWRCGICKQPTNRHAVVPHPKAPTLDHIVPLAKGGEHTRANVQCAHFECNYLKGDKAVTDGEQLRLVG